MWWAKLKGKCDTCSKFFDAWFMFCISENVANNVAIANCLVAMITKTKHANKQHVLWYLVVCISAIVDDTTQVIIMWLYSIDN